MNQAKQYIQISNSNQNQIQPLKKIYILFMNKLKRLPCHFSCLRICGPKEDRLG